MGEVRESAHEELEKVAGALEAAVERSLDTERRVHQENIDAMKSLLGELSAKHAAEEARLGKGLGKAEKGLERTERALESISADIQATAQHVDQIAQEQQLCQERTGHSLQAFDRTAGALSDQSQAIQKELNEQVHNFKQTSQGLADRLAAVEKATVSVAHFDDAIECLQAAQGQKDRNGEVITTFLQERLQELETTVTEKASRRELTEMLDTRIAQLRKDRSERAGEVQALFLQERLTQIESELTQKASRRELVDHFDYRADRPASLIGDGHVHLLRDLDDRGRASPNASTTATPSASRSELRNGSRLSETIATPPPAVRTGGLTGDIGVGGSRSPWSSGRR